MIWLSFVILGISLWIYVFLRPTELEITPVLWFHPDPLPSLSNQWAKNSALIDTIHLNIGNVVAPESIAIDKNSGIGYASLADGRIVSLDIHGNYLEDVFFVGGYIKTNEVIDNTSALYHWCRFEALAGELPWNCTGEKLCGRPLGLRLLEVRNRVLPMLFILDAYHGMFQYDLASSTVKHLFDTSTPQFLGRYQLPTQETFQPRFFNDFDLQMITTSLEDRTEMTLSSSPSPSLLIYFTDTSYLHHRCQNRQAILDGTPSGRLFLFNTSSSTKHLTLLISSLHFPNGVQFLSDSQTLLLAESSRFRLISVMTTELQNHLMNVATDKNIFANQSSLDSLLQKSSDSGVKVHLSSIPGFIDNIRPIPSSPFLPTSLPQTSPLYTLSLGTLSCQPFSLLYLLYQSYWLRIVIRRILPMRYLEHAVPAYGYVAILSESLGVVETYQDPTGRTPFISQGNFHPLTGDLWLGSHSNKFLAVKLREREDQSSGDPPPPVL